MATTTLPQVPPTALDLAGVTVSTAPQSISDARCGSVYDLATVAAMAPVWFHATSSGRYLAVASRRWYAATPHSGNPGRFASHTEDTSPSWFLINGPRRVDVPGYPVDIPMNTPVVSRTLTAAASFSPNYLWLLNSVQFPGPEQAAVVQVIRAFDNGTISISAEETLPSVPVGSDLVIFDKGIQYTSLFLVFYGTDSSGLVYRMRKPWSQIGFNVATTTQTYSTIVGTPRGWEYWTGTGYSLDPTEISPLAGVTTVGPMSFASDPNRSTVVMSTVDYADSTYLGRVWTSASGQPFRLSPVTVALGDLTTYLGGTVQFTPELAVDSSTLAMQGVRMGLLYVTSVLDVNGDGSAMANTWAVWSRS